MTAVESQAESLKLLRHNIAECGMNSLVSVQARTVKQFLARPDLWNGPYDIVFADPPYDMAYKLEDMFETVPAALASSDAWLVVEHASKTIMPDRLGTTTLKKRYQYGDTALSIFSFPDEAVA